MPRTRGGRRHAGISPPSLLLELLLLLLSLSPPLCIQLLQYRHQQPSLSVEHDLQLLTLDYHYIIPNSRCAFLPVLSLRTPFRLIVRPISNQYNPQRRPIRFVNLRFKRYNGSIRREVPPDMLIGRQG